jgi:transposase-like protein
MKKRTNSTVAGRVVREKRYFSEAVRRQIVKDIEGGLSKAEASRRYGVSQTAIYKWMERVLAHKIIPRTTHRGDFVFENRIEGLEIYDMDRIW